MSSGPRWTPAFKALIQDPNVNEEFRRLAAILNAALAGQTTQDAEAGLDNGQTVNTRPIADSGASDFAIRWLKGPWLLNSDGDTTGQAVIRPPQITANQNNYAPDGIDQAIGLELTSDAARSITGMKIASAQRRLLFILNRGTFNLTFPHDSSSSIAANRFGLGTAGESFVLTPGRLVWFFYDVSAGFWRFFALPAVTPGSLPSSLGASGWTLISSQAASGAQVDVTGLSGYNEIMVVLRLVTADSSGIRQCYVSTDNGATFLTSSGDYISLDSNGVESNATYLGFHNTSSTSGLSGWLTIGLFNLATYPKVSNTGFPATNLVNLIPTTSALNAIRIKNSSGNLNGGNIYVFGR